MGASKWPFLDSPPPLAFAHRGAHIDCAENSLESFIEATRLGYRYIETDVRGTLDGELVLSHDADTFRVTGVEGKISRLKLDELRNSSLDTEGHADLLLLEDALGIFPETRFNLDVKDRIAAELIAGVIERTNSYDRVCVTSFSASRIRSVRDRLRREVCIGASISDVATFLVSPGGKRLDSGVAVLQVPLKIRGVRVLFRGFVSKAHHAGLSVHVWTVNDAMDIRTAIDMGVDGIMTDEVVTLKNDLLDRGLWAA